MLDFGHKIWIYNYCGNHIFTVGDRRCSSWKTL